MKVELKRIALTKCVRDVFQRDYCQVSKDMPVLMAASVLLKAGSSSAFVLDTHGKICGIFSETDALTPFVDTVYFEEGLQSVEEVMSKEIVSVTSDTDLIAVAALFKKHSCKRLPVVDHGVLKGQIDRKGLLHGLEKALNELSETKNPPQPPQVGSWAKRFEPEGGSALPLGFEGKHKP